MKLLCNLPLECFEARSAYPDIELCTFGPGDRMLVDGVHHPFDVEFDPSTGSVHELLDRLPPGFRPDLLLIYWPDQEPLPRDLHSAPLPVVGIVSDYNLALPYLSGLWPFFDTLLVDRSGVDLFRRLSFADTRYFCQYTFKVPSHRIYPDVPKDLDIAFAGNLNPVVQAGRAPWLERLGKLSRRGLRSEVRGDIFGAAYGRFLNRAWMGFNRSIRGEMNLRCFEVPACGGVLLLEHDNLEVRDFLLPDHEVVLYDDDNFEELVVELAANHRRCRDIAAAGHRRIQDYRLSHRLRVLIDLLAKPGPSRPASTAAERALGRGVGMLSTWARGCAPINALIEACDLAPDDPRPRNALAVALLRENPNEHGLTAVQLLQATAKDAPNYVPAAFNLVYLLQHTGHPQIKAQQDDLRRRLVAPGWPDLDGPMLPLGYSADAVAKSTSLAAAVRAGAPDQFTATLRTQCEVAPTTVSASGHPRVAVESARG